MFSGIFQPTHLVLILVVVLIIFGPGKLPDVGKAMGNSLREFRRATSSAMEEEEDKKPQVVPTQETTQTK
ncbi:sec-independent protein translocase protein TatA [Desulfotomaculum arcticum]|uniref:Sec-independent protein translocase protein TatA n=1 Tax=Desulfotruncus arcticus DSM 17038 TaxID=1121424 RepID=A0A1I2T7E8_9FIRM|nr:twin-arginine translocase TatA/TatE family subunit [Desulfotruncus arcticus]SFG58496.1 sec-independent protein translocase protein TatA [Desulfotomaculum arcticum] [Desulfotruncus arcticus DSM 17038]